MEKVILVRYGEISLKGLNRSYFMNQLYRNMKAALAEYEEVHIEQIQGRYLVKCLKEDIEQVVQSLTRVFGIVSISPAFQLENDLYKIKKMALDLIKKQEWIKTFKVETKRANKNFPLTSPEISKEIGAHILTYTNHLKVDVHHPDIKIYVEIRDKAYVYHEIIPGVGGLPVGSNGKAALLISGGIDSPVAGYMTAKRGVELIAVHFHSFPFTSDRAKEKVVDLTRILTQYAGPIKLFIVPFSKIQTEIGEKCEERQTTLIMRRFMMKIAEKIAIQEEAKVLITGESIGQVASQTLESLTVTNAAVSIPVFRPLIGMDKQEITEISCKINTYETSILPYEDCCTIFVPKHPDTKPKLEKILQFEKKLDEKNLIEEAIHSMEIVNLP
ncbi:tRNA uracil 4-sulfurtransferase ThiI [Garciella nitratireducens]|uniref:Probable tRNA sulfurtransferase n=1 Tax=Garciella nitratireducens DSM 15102 TaxID=1121911 RepID=A0A1T4K2F7_9FIRM|nr:tRNA uracil 4-sulfurtransferase ThiI [Garciella nitratireducens]SJZ36614.1 thiamine biosynthesis protein ThiI [Garciella nitratireducens DSM 15102]